MRTASHQAAYLEFFFDKPVLPSIRVDPSQFAKYNLNPSSLIHNLGWQTMVSNSAYTFMPDAVRQFYVNIALEGRLQQGKFSTFVDGYKIFVTPQLLADTLGLPASGLALFSESEFHRFGFDAGAVLSDWTKRPHKSRALGIASYLPDQLKVLHYFISRIFLPRSEYLFLVTGLDAWIMHCAVSGRPVNFCNLMFAAMIQYKDHSVTGALPFGPAISHLLLTLNLPLRDRYLTVSPLHILRPRHILPEVGWSHASVSGGVNDISLSDDESEVLANEIDMRLLIEDALAQEGSDSFVDALTQEVSDGFVDALDELDAPSDN